MKIHRCNVTRSSRIIAHHASSLAYLPSIPLGVFRHPTTRERGSEKLANDPCSRSAADESSFEGWKGPKSSPHPPHQPAEPLGSKGGDSKLTNVLESGRLCIRLLLDTSIKLLKAVGPAGSWWSRPAPSSLPRSRVQQRRSGRLLTSRCPRSEPSPLQAAFFGRSHEPTPGQSSVSPPLR